MNEAAPNREVVLGSNRESDLPTAPVSTPVVGWRPIETAPRDGTAVLGCWTFPDRSPLFGVVSWGEAPEDDTWAGSEEGWREGESCVAGLTHWTPLPPAPDARQQAAVSPDTQVGMSGEAG